MFTLYGGKKGYHLTPNGLALQFYAYGYALARMQRLMSPIGVKIMDTISLLQVLIRFYRIYGRRYHYSCYGTYGEGGRIRK